MPFTDPFVANPYPYSFAQTLTLANTLYDITESLVSGVYTISWSGGGTLNVDFYNGTTLVTSTSGTSSITVNLAQGVTNYKLWASVGGISVIISLSALSLAPISGTLYTYTASGTIPLVGDGYCVVVGGGGAGGGSSAGGGGGSGGITGGRILLTGSLSLTIGTGGIGVINSAGGAGTSTILGSFTAGGGGGGLTGGGAGVAGTPGGGAGGTGPGSPSAGVASANSNTIFTFCTMGTTGGGAGASISTSVGSGIGTGGNSLSLNATGYGAGGAGSNTVGLAGGNGTAGVCYIII